jgi:predicted nucleic acid-binding Zn ribbon protein
MSSRYKRDPKVEKAAKRRETNRRRTLQIIFYVFTILIILSMILSATVNF